ncbi:MULTISPECIES: non-hydrolyzing UDP-N-acetylglucosamine 2-epimerase [unclassified Campylobacter]|uniref:non-hydrolyzing UDP-N-acetylglucosamine 2-epimerase n=1 Tax=unclassified Campylobacter TaxID=2593542 RepID=UPI0022EA078B|nr:MULTISPECIES: UDP-N-acetylglucosamine 2-epimerase (non-hydrolyzing) [unclassified Campylobacter]MDA3043934.1 UDP-N-acetylglucosamine 2-epimerase (non-hydrolyzing) [Campylobacter sp. JMF_09 ED2]MDA3045471.1 UDP-N-acetylglucosamine 2-epimerase (non-hydrolyzing) [Campylobacter sp. JMF_07 ED4]MDA3064109.1 UDP-N-acetylglucosamine 2-epimerase (non-hydrolyzing) [Campylobacter sp. JMF_11 EL3]MDA3072019.1 UDP-N-acetylglucosamine 2-epimerase (non-hydrolyzing) [Campylobacter sp. VBCF_03 NA9]MDA3075716
MKKNRKILIVFGTRPEAIKMTPLVKEFDKYKDLFETKVCVTAQHREMLDQVLNFFDIKADYDLNLMKPNQTLYDISAKILVDMRQILNDFKPDIVFVHGDTTTASMVALSAFYSKIKIAHIEAGLRTHNMYSPFPEEANRQIVGILADYHFAPTNQAMQNLLQENKKQENIIVTGNTVIDALHLAVKKIKNDKDIANNIIKSLEYKVIDNRKFILVTGHRRENFGEGFLNICNALKDIALKNPNIDIVYPVHLNPNVQKPVNEILSNLQNVYLIKPLSYENFVYLMEKSYFIITDSGGIQEEAPSLGKPVLVMRDTTERPEAIKAGTVKLVGTDRAIIFNEAQNLLNDKDKYDEMSSCHNPYGDGKACEKILKFLGNLNG